MTPEPATDSAIIPIGAQLIVPSAGVINHAPTTQEPAAQADSLYTGLKQWQRDVLAARILVMKAIDTYMEETGVSLNRSIKAFITSLSNGGPANLKRAADIANHRKGNSRLLSQGTIYRWYQIVKDEGRPGLIPTGREPLDENDIPLWLPDFLDAYRQPSKPTIPAALKEMGPDAPPYHTVLRFLKRFSTLDIHRGRMSGSELRAIRAYIKRDFSDLLPMDIIVADGHSFKAHVAHPVHGKRFLPEVEAVIDVATRACVGWSVGLAESGIVVADALRHAATISDDKPMGGLFAIVYTDNGAGNRARMNSDEVTGIVSRLGGTIKFGIAGNAQGRGVIERLNASLWIPSAKKLITYNGKDMDALSQRRRLKIIDRDLKERGSSQHLISWPQFIDFLAAEVAAYNCNPHTSLPKITDAGHKRHMTPTERWQAFGAAGWQPDTLNPEEMRDLFRPQVSVATRRGLVTVFTNEYFNAELEHHHGETVFVNYDIHDPNVVWVRDRQQRLICEAHWNANRRAYYPMAVVEQAREKRKERRLALKREQIREIEEEAKGVVDAETAIPEECIREADQLDSVPACKPEDSGQSPQRPFFENNTERYSWHVEHGEHTEEDRVWIAWYTTTPEYRLLFAQ